MEKTILQSTSKKEASTVSVRQKFTELRDAANSTFAERKEQVELLLLALLSKQNAFLHGVPGTAKSALVRYIQESIVDSTGFQILLSKFTTPEQVFGSFDGKKFEEGAYEVLTDGYLPKADVAFLDEIWKSSNAILNSLLTLVNERKFANGNKNEDCPLVSAFAASNELPQSAELNALYDRFMLRSVVKPVSTARTLTSLFGGKSFKSAPAITLDELAQAHEEIKNVKVPAAVKSDAAKIIFALRKEGIEISDRAAIAACAESNPITGEKTLSVIKAVAWLDGRTSVESSDLGVLIHCFWYDPEEIPVVVKTVLKTANPYEQKAVQFEDQLRKLKSEVEKKIESGESVLSATSDVHTKVVNIKASIAKIIGESGDDANTTKVKRLKEVAKESEKMIMNFFDLAAGKAGDVIPEPAVQLPSQR